MADKDSFFGLGRNTSCENPGELVSGFVDALPSALGVTIQARMKLKTPKSLESWLFSVGAVLLIIMGIMWAIASIWAAYERAHVPSGETLGIAAIYLIFDLPIAILELAGLICVALSALVSIFRTLLPSKPK